MTKKFCVYFLVLVCLFFSFFSYVSADEIKQYQLDYSSTNLSHVGDYVITDFSTNTSYTFSDVFDEIIERYSSDYKFFIVITEIDSRRLCFDLYQFKENTTIDDYKIRFTYESRQNFYTFRLNTSNTNHKQFYFLDNSGSSSSFNDFTMSDLISTCDDFFAGNTGSPSNVLYFPIYNFNTVYNAPLFYYSNVDVALKDTDKEIKFIDVNGRLSYVLPESGANVLFYLRNASRYDRLENPRPIFNVFHPTFENDVCVSADISIDFSFFDEYHENMYSLDSNFITIDKATNFSVTQNGSIVAKSFNLNNSLYYNEKTFNFDFIGRDKAYFDSFAENLYNSNFDEDISSITLNSATSIPDYLRYWYLSIKRTFPVVFQMKDLISLFDSSRHVDTCNSDINSCLSLFTLDLSFFGIQNPVSAFDSSSFLSYRTRLFTIISFFVAIATFNRALFILQTMSKKE